MYIPPGVGWLVGWLQAFKATTSSEINGLRMEVTSAVQALAQTGAIWLVGLGEKSPGSNRSKTTPQTKNGVKTQGFVKLNVRMVLKVIG